MLRYGTVVPTTNGLYPLDPGTKILKGGLTGEPENVHGLEGQVRSAVYHIVDPINLNLICGKDLLVLTPEGYQPIDQVYKSRSRLIVETKINKANSPACHLVYPPTGEIYSVDRIAGRALGWFWITYPLTRGPGKSVANLAKTIELGPTWKEKQWSSSKRLLHGYDLNDLMKMARVLGFSRFEPQKPFARSIPFFQMTRFGPDFLTGFLEGYCAPFERYDKNFKHMKMSYHLDFPLSSMIGYCRLLFILLGVFPQVLSNPGGLKTSLLGFCTADLERLRSWSFGGLVDNAAFTLEGSIRRPETAGIRKKYQVNSGVGRLYYRPLKTSWFGLSI